MSVATVALPSAQRIGQATAVEQSRAVAEVQAAIVVAQQCPRDVPRAQEAMRESCRQLALAERAFFRYNRGGSQITGPSVQLARELARCWGNIQYGISELRRDDSFGQSEMQAWAWDVQMNSRSVTTFVVPHKRDTKKGIVPLTDMRDIYENNANNGARRVREMIFAILPPWFVEEAKDLCNTTLIDGAGDKPLATRVADMVEAYSRQGIDEARMVAKIGRPSREWTVHDLAQFKVIGTSIARGETTVEDEFPTPSVQRVTGAELADQGKPAESAGDPTSAGTTEGTSEGTEPAAKSAEPVNAAGQEAAATPPERTGKRASSQKQRAKIQILGKELGLDSKGEGRDEYLAMLTEIACRPIETSTDLTWTEAGWVIEKFEKLVASAPAAKPAAEASPERSNTTQAEAGPPTPADGPPVQDRDNLLERIFRGAQQRGIESERVSTALKQEYGQPVEDLDADQLQHFLAKLALGTIRIPPGDD